MKKTLAILLVLAMVFALAACSGGAGGSSAGSSSSAPESASSDASQEESQEESSDAGGELPEGVKSEEEFTITYFEFSNTPDATELLKRFYDEVEDKWYAMYPNSTLEIQGVPDEGLELLQTQLASGTAADVFKHQTRLAAFAQAGYLYDLSDQPWTDSVVDGCMPDCYFDGKFWAAPADCNGWGIYYVKQIYEDELGLGIPNNFDEFKEICQTIKDAGYDPLVTGGADGWPFQGLFLTFTSFLYGANENFHVDLYDGKASFAGPETKDLFNAVQELYDAGYFSDATISITIEQARQYMGEQTAVMGFGCPGVLTPLEEDDSGYDVDLGFYYIPDRNGYNCLPVIADVVFSVNSAYEHASTRGIDLLNCLIAEDALHAAYDNVSPVGFEGMSMDYNTLGGQMYQEAFDKGPVVLQCTSWLPPSIFDLYQQVVSSIISGNGFTDEMLQNMQTTYEADKANVNVLR